MTDQEKFEQWISKYHIEKTPSNKTLLGLAEEVWQAAKQDSAAELQVKRDIIIEMECRMKEMRADSAAEIAELKDTLDAIRRHRITYEVIIGEHESTIAQLQAENLKLRKALTNIMGVSDIDDAKSEAKEALGKP